MEFNPGTPALESALLRFDHLRSTVFVEKSA